MDALVLPCAEGFCTYALQEATMKYPRIGSTVEVVAQSTKDESGEARIVGLVLADRYPDSMLGLRNEQGQCLRIPLSLVLSVNPA